MKMKLMLGVALGVTGVMAAGTDWPQWHGPNRDNLSAETGLLKEWPAEGPALAWKAENLGGGFSACR